MGMEWYFNYSLAKEEKKIENYWAFPTQKPFYKT